MTRFRSIRTSRRSAALPLISALVLATVAGSCDRSDSNQLAIDKANLNLEGISNAGSSVMPSVARRKEVFNDVVTKLKPIADNADAALAPAAAMLVARSKGGLGEIASKDAAELEDQFRSQITVARGQLDQWISQHSTAAALLMYDPAKDIADLDKQTAERFAEGETRQKDKAAQEALVADIQARSDQAHAAAKKERDREAGIRKQAEGLSQTERESLIQKAVEASRAADALDRQASELGAEAAKESPKITELGHLVEQLQRQVESLKKSKDGILARVAAAKQQAEAATTEANAAGAKIKTTLDGLTKIREAAGTPSQESLKQYAAAAAGAKKAMATSVPEAKTAATTALGGYEQCIGDVLATRARSLAVYGATLDAIAKATPAMPGVSEIAAKATAANAELETTSKEAEAAYSEALAAYEKSGGKGDVKARMEAAHKSLKELTDLRTKPVSEPKAAPATEAKPAEVKGEEGKPAAAAPAPAATALSADDAKAVETEVRAMMKEIAAASAASDFEKVMSHVAVANDQEKKMIQSGLPLGGAFKSLNAACVAKFGKDLGTLAKACEVPSVKNNPLLPMLGVVGKGNAMDADPDAVVIKPVSLTEAELSAPESPATMHVAKQEGAWKITGLGALMGGPMAAQMMPMVKGLTGAFTKITGGINEGKYPTSDDMLTDLSAQLMGAMSGMMGGGGGGEPKTKPVGTKPPAGGG